MSTSPETTAEWVEQEMGRVLDSYPKDEVDLTMPHILLLMTQEFGFENLQPKLQNAVQVILIAAGVRPETTEEESQSLVAAYTAKLKPSHGLLRDIQKVFEQHYRALGQDQAGNFKRFADQGAVAKPLKPGEKPPEGALSLDRLKFPRRL